MEKQKQNLIDVSRLYTLKKYSKEFNIPYPTVYGKFNTSVTGRARKPMNIVEISGIPFVFLTEDEEKELRLAMSNKINK